MEQKIVQVAEGAYFVSSYSVQTITRAYQTDVTAQFLGAYPDNDVPASEFELDPKLTEPPAANTPSTPD